MKKSKKFVIGIVLLAVGVIGLFGMFGNTEDKGALLGGSIFLIAAGVVLVVLDKKLPGKSKPVLQPSPVAATRDIYAEAEEARKSNDYYPFSLSGVSFSNDDGTERQDILKGIYNQDNYYSYSLKQYDYNGEAAVAVYANDIQIGVVPKKVLSFVLENFERILGVYSVSVSSNYEDEEEIPEDEERKFFAEVTLCLKK